MRLSFFGFHSAFVATGFQSASRRQSSALANAEAASITSTPGNPVSERGIQSGWRGSLGPTGWDTRQKRCASHTREIATVHGFRSSFRDWAGNVSHFPREVTETALAHVIGDKAEQAYRRSDALEKRRKLMEAWAAYCEPKISGNVVQMSKQKRS